MRLSSSFPPLLREIYELRNQGVYRLIFQGFLVGTASGAVIGLFRLVCVITNQEIVTFGKAYAENSLPAALLIAVILIGLGLISGWLIHKEPLLSGSGIPQVELTLRDHLSLRHWARLLIGKFIGTWICLSSGLSVGREGPSIFMGATVGQAVGELQYKGTPVPPRFLIGGSVAGMTAAFGAPLAGMLFAFEEMRVILSAPLLLFTICAALSAWTVVDGFFNFGLVYQFAALTPLSLKQHLLLIPLGGAIGILGAAYNTSIIWACNLWEKQHIVGLYGKTTLPFLCAGALFYCYPYVLVGFGIDLEQLETHTLAFAAIGLLLIIKILFSILSFSSGISGGLLMPMLAIGGMTGAFAGVSALEYSLLDPQQMGVIITVSMGALFGATVRAPLTGTALILEMTGAWSLTPALLITVFVATFTANRLGSMPIYDAIKLHMLTKQRRLRHTRNT